MNDAVDFWNRQLAEIGSGFRLGPVRFVSEILPPSELATLSQATLDGQRALVGPPSGFMQIEDDLIIALSDGAFVSFAMSFQKTDKRLIAIHSFQGAPFRFTNVGRNVMAHELGHAIGLGHNNDPNKLMCGRPAPCRPDVFRSDVERIFPLMEEEKQILLKLYPPTWRDVQTGTGSVSVRLRKVRHRRRNTVVKHLLENGYDIQTVQEYGGAQTFIRRSSTLTVFNRAAREFTVRRIDAELNTTGSNQHRLT